jgi:hypothetical protein
MKAAVDTFEERSDKMEAKDMEAILEATESAVEQQELRDRLVVRCRRWAKNRTQNSVGSRQKLSVAWKRMIRRAVPVVCKGRVRKGPGKIKAASSLVTIKYVTMYYTHTFANNRGFSAPLDIDL